MKLLKTILQEIVGLFVDDLGFSLLVVAWAVIAAFLLPRLGVAADWSALILFLGCAAILVFTTARATLRRG